MTKLDATETGFYTKSLICDIPDFEDNKSYTLCVKATVDSVTGGIVYKFSAHEEIDTPIGLPIIIQGFDAMSGRQIHITGRYK